MRADTVAKIIMLIVCSGAGFLHSTVITHDDGHKAHPLGYCLQVKVLSHMSSTRISAARGGKGSVAAYTPYFHEPFAPTHGYRYAMRLMRLCNMPAIRLA